MIADEKILNLFINIQSLINPDISIEIGAHDADFSKEMKSFGVDIFAFEASPYVYNRFKNDMEEINYINKAVSDKNENIKFEIQMDVDPSIAGNNSIKNRNEKKDYSYIEIESVSVDEYFKDINFSNGALWIDVEGASREVLFGAKERLKDFLEHYSFKFVQKNHKTLSQNLGINKIHSEGIMLLENGLESNDILNGTTYDFVCNF
jgi:FkbM family methyltransferase